jgi:hypothetical protein
MVFRVVYSSISKSRWLSLEMVKEVCIDKVENTFTATLNQYVPGYRITVAFCCYIVVSVLKARRHAH